MSAPQITVLKIDPAQIGSSFIAIAKLKGDGPVEA